MTNPKAVPADTPRTDKAWANSKYTAKGVDMFEALEESRTLERELAAAKVERDRVVGLHKGLMQAKEEELAAAKVDAVKLWKLLDDIDTLDDAYRSDDKAFRIACYAKQRQRFSIISGEQFDAARKEGE